MAHFAKCEGDDDERSNELLPRAGSQARAGTLGLKQEGELMRLVLATQIGSKVESALIEMRELIQAAFQDGQGVGVRVTHVSISSLVDDVEARFREELAAAESEGATADDVRAAHARGGLAAVSAVREALDALSEVAPEDPADEVH